MELLFAIFILTFVFLEVNKLLYKSFSLFIILILLGFLLKKKDNFNPGQCEFIPFGNTRTACIDRCMSDDRDNWGGEMCDDNACQRICDRCSENCKWKLASNVPNSPVIKIISGNQNAKLNWISPHSDTAITAYSLFIKDNSNDENVRIDFPPDVNCNLCEYIINNLKNDKEYEVFLHAKNINGYSEKSNTLKIVPTVNQTIGDDQPEVIVTEPSVENEFLKEFETKNLIDKVRVSNGNFYASDSYNVEII